MCQSDEPQCNSITKSIVMNGCALVQLRHCRSLILVCSLESCDRLDNLIEMKKNIEENVDIFLFVSDLV